MTINLFSLEHGRAVVSAEARTIQSYAKIIDRDKSDHHEKALAELAYVYFTIDYRSPFIHSYSEKKRDEVVKKRVGLPESWSPDKVVQQAIEEYGEDQKSVSSKALDELRETMHSTGEFSKMIRGMIDEIVQSKSKDDEKIEGAIKKLEQLIGISTKLPKVIENMDKLEENVKKELAANTKINSNVNPREKR